MKKLVLSTLLLLFLSISLSAQTDRFWSSYKGEASKINVSKGAERVSFPKKFDLYNLNLTILKQELLSKKGAIISLPNSSGKLEQFQLFESSNFDADLQAKFPEIRAYSGQGITDKHATLKLSISPQGIQTMVFRTDKENEFMEPYSADGSVYAVFSAASETQRLPWNCSTDDKNLANSLLPQAQSTSRSSVGKLLTFRLAMSCTGEYAAFHGGTTSSVLAAVNNTMTRVNGVFEKDLAIHMNLVNNTSVLYLDSTNDPYGNDDTNYNSELQSALDTNVGSANYDIGHLVSAIGNNGNAGCIGCVCDSADKGSGYTTSTSPIGDNFDIDFVAHEMGHQYGANHSFSFSSEDNSVNFEVGSGSTIMGYAGITPYDVQPHSDEHFHAGNIAQIQTNMTGKTCPVETTISHSAPSVNAGADYTIPKSTPFILTGTATDAGGGTLSYCWEQYNDAAAAQLQTACPAAVGKTAGPNWMSYPPKSTGVRYMPRLETVLANSQTTQGEEIAIEALSSVARTLNFRLTVRDNVLGGGQTNFDNSVITVSGTVGPFEVTSQATSGQSWTQGTTENIVWTVNNTTTLPGSANVDILLSTDGGLTFPTVLVANTPNDGTENITVPNVTSTDARVMVRPTGHIYYDINAKPILIGYTQTNTCNNYTINPNAAIPDNTTTYLTHGLNVTTTDAITDVNLAVNLTHTYIGDILVAVLSPAGTQVNVFSRSCTSNDNINATFDDQGSAIVCATTIIGSVIPAQALSTLNGENPNGTWTFGVNDNAAADTGTINSYTLTVCSTTYTLVNKEFEFDNFSLYPNPNSGNFTIKFNSESSNDIEINVHDIQGREVYQKSFSNTGAFNQNIHLNKIATGVYLVSIIDGAKKTVKRIVVE